jgi:hypothetical protein
MKAVLSLSRVGIALACLIELAGCASVKESYGPDGRKAYALNCSGTARGWDKCFAAAGNICGAAGYDVLDKSSEAMSVATASGGNGSFGASAVKTAERTMLVSCKAR